MSVVHSYTKNLEQYTCILKFNRKGVFFINGNKVETFYNGHPGDLESRRYGAVSVGVKYDTDIFLGFSIFILKKA